MPSSQESAASELLKFTFFEIATDACTSREAAASFFQREPRVRKQLASVPNAEWFQFYRQTRRRVKSTTLDKDNKQGRV
jgi:hypothetical protein